MSAAPLELRGFSAGYSASEIRVADATFSLARGTMTALVGPNGAGKSTLLKGILRLTPVHDASSVRFFGEPLDRVRSRVAYLPQRSEIDWTFPACALDVVAMGLYRRLGLFRRVGRAARDEALAALALVGLEDAASKPIGELSGGQRQRLLVARALVQRADIVLLDEPFANVDEVTEQAIASVLQKLRGEGTTILAVHHDLGTVRLSSVQSHASGSQGGLRSLLFGSAAATNRGDIIALATLAFAALVVLIALFKEFSALAFDEQHAQSLGLPVRTLDLVLMVLLVATVVSGMQVAGIVLVVALLVTPAAAARAFRGSIARVTAIGAIIGALSAAIGVILSLRFEELPTGSAMTLAATAIFFVTLLLPGRMMRGALT